MSLRPYKNHGWILGIVATALTLVPGLATAGNPKIRVTVGQSVTQKFATQVKTVSIADSDVADVVVAGPQEVLVNGKGIGLTTLVVWDQNNVSSMFDVVVRGPFSDQKIELRVQVAEFNRNKARELGFDFAFGTDKVEDLLEGGTFGGPVAVPELPLRIFGGAPVEGVQGAFRWVTGGSEIQTMIRALHTDGVIRLLAEPKMVAASGEEASFLSGGEIPIPVATQSSGTGQTITVEWKEYGVKVKFLPTIVDSQVINLAVEPEVSSIDYANAIQLSGFELPAIRARRAKTTVELRDREILVIGGLIIEEENTIKNRIPVLGHIPILGALFSNEISVKNTNELMLVVSPHIVRSLPPGSQVKLPGTSEEGM